MPFFLLEVSEPVVSRNQRALDIYPSSLSPIATRCDKYTVQFCSYRKNHCAWWVLLRVCVCVNPGSKGYRVSRWFQHASRGVVRGLGVTTQRRHSLSRGDIRKGRLLDVPALNTLTPLVPLAAVLCFHGCSHATFPINRFPPFVRCR